MRKPLRIAATGVGNTAFLAFVFHSWVRLSQHPAELFLAGAVSMLYLLGFVLTCVD